MDFQRWSLPTRVLASVIIGLLIVLVIAQVWQSRAQIETITALNNTSFEMLKKRDDANVQNLLLSLRRSVAGSLERGEMEKFDKLLKQQQEITGLNEFSLFSREGKLIYSSTEQAIGRQMPSDIKAKTDLNQEVVVNEANAIKIYRPEAVNADCLRCHATWKEGENGGTLFLDYQTNLGNVSRDNETALKEVRSNVLRMGTIVVIVTLVILAATTWGTIRMLVGRPVQSMAYRNRLNTFPRLPIA